MSISLFGRHTFLQLRHGTHKRLLQQGGRPARRRNSHDAPLTCRRTLFTAMPTAYRIVLMSLICGAVAFHPYRCSAQATATTADPVSQAIALELDRLMNPGVTTIHGARIALRERLQEFYTRRGFRPAWTNARNAQQLREALANSYNDGLDPEDYHFTVIESISQNISGTNSS